jgi:hypothetical protein
LVRSIHEHSKQTAPSQADGVIILPRIMYENRIVIQRKLWHVSKNRLPVRANRETDAAYFLRLQQWRHELDMPDEVFMRGAYYKPQYISFNNPFLAAIFESCARSCNDTLEIEEMLPNSNQLAPTRGRVVEFLTQWEA